LPKTLVERILPTKGRLEKVCLFLPDEGRRYYK
jgi:hypothetical protein